MMSSIIPKKSLQNIQSTKTMQEIHPWKTGSGTHSFKKNYVYLLAGLFVNIKVALWIHEDLCIMHSHGITVEHILIYSQETGDGRSKKVKDPNLEFKVHLWKEFFCVLEPCIPEKASVCCLWESPLWHEFIPRKKKCTIRGYLSLSNHKK